MRLARIILSYPAQVIDDLVYHLSGGKWELGLAFTCITLGAPPVE